MSEDCDVALAELYEFLDGELDDTARARIEQHLRDCSPCLEAFDFEAELRKMVAERCQEPCPDALKARIQQLLEGGSAPAGEPAS